MQKIGRFLFSINIKRCEMPAMRNLAKVTEPEGKSFLGNIGAGDQELSLARSDYSTIESEHHNMAYEISRE